MPRKKNELFDLDLPEGTPGNEADPVVQPGTDPKPNTRRQRTMLELLKLADKRIQEPEFSTKVDSTLHALSDYTKTPKAYNRQQRIILTIARAGQPQVKKNMTGYVFVEHRDLYDAHASGRRVQVESDKTTFVIVGHYVDHKNVMGRSLRLSKAKPVTTLRDTLQDLLDMGLEETDPEPEGA